MERLTLTKIIEKDDFLKVGDEYMPVPDNYVGKTVLEIEGIKPMIFRQEKRNVISDLTNYKILYSDRVIETKPRNNISLLKIDKSDIDLNRHIVEFLSTSHYDYDLVYGFAEILKI